MTDKTADTLRWIRWVNVAFYLAPEFYPGTMIFYVLGLEGSIR